MVNARNKGKRGELMLKTYLNNLGFDTKRDGQQGSGDAGEHADVVGIEGLHIECKFVENLNFHKAMEQSKRDARDGEVPVVCSKRSREEWLVTLRAVDFFKMWKELYGND